MTTTFIPCGAKMPIIALFAGALFGGSGLVATSAYFIGVASIIMSGIILKKMRPFAGEAAPFVMELPAYHIPSALNVFRAAWERGWSFIRRAGTVILVSSVALWFLQAFGITDGVFGMVEDNNTSLLAMAGNAVAPIFPRSGSGIGRRPSLRLPVSLRRKRGGNLRRALRVFRSGRRRSGDMVKSCREFYPDYRVQFHAL
jgi:ferrous iron transport protein B